MLAAMVASSSSTATSATATSTATSSSSQPSSSSSSAALSSLSSMNANGGGDNMTRTPNNSAHHFALDALPNTNAHQQQQLPQTTQQQHLLVRESLDFSSSSNDVGATAPHQYHRPVENGSSSNVIVDDKRKSRGTVDPVDDVENSAVASEEHPPTDAIIDSSGTSADNVVVASSSAIVDNKNNDNNDPLPAELRRILVEVASTGTCSWLAWTAREHPKQSRSSSSSVLLENNHSDSNGVASTGGGSGEAGGAAGTHQGILRGYNNSNNSSSMPSSSGTTATAGQQLPPCHHHHHHAAASYNHHQQHQRKFQSSSSTGAPHPPRKKQKHCNGLLGVVRQKNKRRFADTTTSTTGQASAAEAAVGGSTTGSTATDTTTTNRKRPLFSIRNSSSTSAFAMSCPNGSVGSGRMSSDEPEDTSQSYDSECTSASDCSGRKVAANPNPSWQQQPSAAPPSCEPAYSYSCQKDAFRVAMQLVLDFFFNKKGGYTLSPAEKTRNQSVMAGGTDEPFVDAPDSQQPILMEAEKCSISAEDIYLQRRRRLLKMLEPSQAAEDGPPFTTQRFAEILVAPERYYSQTQKLCNALEKLLLISSSTNAFGGFTGGVSSQSRREDQELAALAEEQGRVQLELRQRRRRQCAASALDEQSDSSSNGFGPYHGGDTIDGRSMIHKGSDHGATDGGEGDLLEAGASDVASREMLEAAARASLRTKFDHVGIDPHSAGVVNRDVRAIAENRGMTNSPPPPPPSLSMAATAPGYIHSGLLRHHASDHEHSPPTLARGPSPILFNPSSDSVLLSPPMMGAIHPNAANMHVQMHHTASLAGVSPFELMSLHQNSEAGIPSPAAPGLASMPTKEVDLESRSSASSDVDSESDMSFDDSASDRSDGSDSGHYNSSNEPFSAARAMALNRMLQQQRQMQASRMLNTSTMLHHNNQVVGGEASGLSFQPDLDYQSVGDDRIMDSMTRPAADDSGGSDSSSPRSDVAD